MGGELNLLDNVNHSLVLITLDNHFYSKKGTGPIVIHIHPTNINCLSIISLHIYIYMLPTTLSPLPPVLFTFGVSN